MAIFNIREIVFARERLTVTNGAVVSLTAATYEQAASPKGGNQIGTYKRRAIGALIFLEASTGSLHYSCLAGAVPTTGATVNDIGAVAQALDMIILDSHEAIANFQALATSATNSIIEVWYLR